jgi:hypothetical protein
MSVDSFGVPRPSGGSGLPELRHAARGSGRVGDSTAQDVPVSSVQARMTTLWTLHRGCPAYAGNHTIITCAGTFDAVYLPRSGF